MADSDLIEIVDPTTTTSPHLDAAKYTAHVRSPAAGAIATFEGTTRDTFNGHRVVELRYESYVPMALRELRSIVARARSSWSLDRVAVAHRLGTVPVGEASVFVAASAVHRSDALEACRFVIDEVKASVPIWKKEVYENGEVWKENREFLERDHGKLKCGCGNKIRVVEGKEAEEDKEEVTSVVSNGNGVGL